LVLCNSEQVLDVICGDSSQVSALEVERGKLQQLIGDLESTLARVRYEFL
jgi:hypothetical protein